MASSTRPGTARSLSCPRSEEVVRMWGSLNLLPVTVVDLPFTDLIGSSYRLPPKKTWMAQTSRENKLFWKAQVPPHHVFRRHRDGGGIVVNKIGSLRSTTRRQRQRHKFCIFNDQKQNLSTRFTYFFISVHFFSVLGKCATWNDHFSSFNENVNTQARIGIFFPSLDTAPLNLVPE